MFLLYMGGGALADGVRRLFQRRGNVGGENRSVASDDDSLIEVRVGPCMLRPIRVSKWAVNMPGGFDHPKKVVISL